MRLRRWPALLECNCRPRRQESCDLHLISSCLCIVVLDLQGSDCRISPFYRPIVLEKYSFFILKILTYQEISRSVIRSTVLELKLYFSVCRRGSVLWSLCPQRLRERRVSSSRLLWIESNVHKWERDHQWNRSISRMIGTHLSKQIVEAQSSCSRQFSLLSLFLFSLQQASQIVACADLQKFGRRFT